MTDRPTPLADATQVLRARRGQDLYQRFLVGVMFDLPTAPTDEEAHRIGTVIADSVETRFAQQQWPPQAVYEWPQAHLWYPPDDLTRESGWKPGRMTALRSLSRVPYSTVEAVTALIPSTGRLHVHDLTVLYHRTMPLRWFAAAVTERHAGHLPTKEQFRIQQLWNDMLGVGTGPEVDVEQSIGWMRLHIRPEDGTPRGVVMRAGFKEEWQARYERWREVPGGPWWPLAGFSLVEAAAMLADAPDPQQRAELLRSVKVLSRLGAD